MPNIISHNCVGSMIYKEKGLRYENPFMWCVIPPDDFRYLYEHYDDIDFRRISLEKDGKFYKIVIDGKVSVYYVHYKYSKNATEPRVQNGMDLVYSGIEDYISDKYRSRLARMEGRPLFIVTDREYLVNKQWNFSKEDIERYVGKDDCLVAVYDRTIRGDNVVYMPERDMDPAEIAKILKDRI